MSWFVAAALLLGVSTFTAGVSASLWPKAARDAQVALLVAASVALWIVFSGAHPGPTLVPIGFAGSLTLADLGGVPGLMLGGLLMGRTIILARQHARAVAAQQVAQRAAARVEATAETVGTADAAETVERPGGDAATGAPIGRMP